MSQKKTYLSQEKYNELAKELDFLKGTRRKEIADQLEQAKAFGDLSENAEYHQAREAQGAVEGRILDLEEMLKSAEIVSRHKSDTVDIGTSVHVRKGGESTDRLYEIVGSEEADTASGKISLHSPLGQALMGKRKGDTFTFKSPTGKQFAYTITKLE